MISTEFPPVTGGVATYNYELSRNLVKQGHSVTAVLPGSPMNEHERAEFAKNGITAQKVPFHGDKIPKPFWYAAYPLILLVYLLSTWAIARKTKCDAMMAAYWFPDGYIAKFVAGRMGIDYCVGAYGLDILKVGDHAGKVARLSKVLQGASKVICVSDYTARKVQSLGVPPDRTVVIGGGINVDSFYPSNEGDRIRKRHGLGDRPVIFTVGRLVYYKGFHLVIEALPGLIKEFPDLMYIIGGSGPEQDYLTQLSESLGVQDHVTLVGRIANDELRAYYNACDIFAMPNYVGKVPWEVEGFGIVFMEAAACGKPVIVGNSGGAPDALIDGETGFLVPEKDIETLRQKLALLIGDENLRLSMGKAGLARAQSEFTWYKLAQVLGREMELTN